MTPAASLAERLTVVRLRYGIPVRHSPAQNGHKVTMEDVLKQVDGFWMSEWNYSQ